MKEKEKTFYVGVHNSNDVRKQLLECSKDIVGILKNYDRINTIRKEKIEKSMELNKILNDIRKLNLIFKERLPSNKLRAIPVKIKRGGIKKKSFKKSVPKKAENPPNHKIKILEQELNEIEERLDKMGL